MSSQTATKALKAMQPRTEIAVGRKQKGTAGRAVATRQPKPMVAIAVAKQDVAAIVRIDVD